MTISPWVGLLIAYGAGSIPFGILISRWMAGVDPRKAGSGNIGFTNVLRVAGRGAGLLTLLGDMGKGYLMVELQRSLSPGELWIWSAGVCVVLGHNYSLFLQLRGGKGVATGLGVLYGINPFLGWAVGVIWALSVVLWRYSSLGAVISFGVLPLLVLFLNPGVIPFAFSIIFSGLILLKHRSNIHRLRTGSEPRILSS